MAEAPTVGSEAPIGVKLLSSPVLVVRDPTSVITQSDREVERQIGADPMNTMDFHSIGQLDGMERGSHPMVPSLVNASVCGSPLHSHQ